MLRTGGRGLCFVLTLFSACDLHKALHSLQRKEKALNSRGFLLPCPPQGCSTASCGCLDQPLALWVSYLARGAQEGLASCGSLVLNSNVQHDSSQVTLRSSGVLLRGSSKPPCPFPELSANTS